MFLVWPLGVLFLAFQLGLTGFLFITHGYTIFLEKSSVCTLSHLRFTFRSLDILCKNIPLNISMISESKRRLFQNTYGGFFTFCMMNIFGFEWIMFVLQVILIIISFTLIPSGCYFNGLDITPVLGWKLISEDIWVGIQFCAFPCVWNLWTLVCTIFLSIIWYCCFCWTEISFW